MIMPLSLKRVATGLRLLVSKKASLLLMAFRCSTETYVDRHFMVNVAN